MNSKWPPPASAMRRRSVSSKSAPTPKAVVTTRRSRQAAHWRHDLVVVGDAAVREAVGQEEAAAHGFGREVLGHLLAAPEPAAVQVGGLPRLDARHEVRRGLARLRRRERGGDDDVDAVVVRHDGEAVLRPERSKALEDGLARVHDLLAAHGAGAVEDEGEVDGKAPRLGRGLGRLDLDAQEAAAAGSGADQLAVGVDIHDAGSVGVWGAAAGPEAATTQSRGWKSRPRLAAIRSGTVRIVLRSPAPPFALRTVLPPRSRAPAAETGQACPRTTLWIGPRLAAACIGLLPRSEAILITVYLPDPQRWSDDFRRRRASDVRPE